MKLLTFCVKDKIRNVTISFLCKLEIFFSQNYRKSSLYRS